MLTRLSAVFLLLPLLACSGLQPEREESSQAANPWESTALLTGLSTPLTEARIDGPQAVGRVLTAKASPWTHKHLPGKQANEFSYARVDGRDAMAVKAESSASLMRQDLRVEAENLGRVRFSWKVPELIALADMARRESDDSPVRIVLAFEGDRSSFSLKNAMLSELSHALTGEPLPYATLMYVWCNTRPAGSVIVNPRTDRIRKIVVESGARNLNHWLDYERDVRADYEKAFGEPPGALLAVGIMTDTDNTQSKVQAWYGPLHLLPLAVAQNAP